MFFGLTSKQQHETKPLKRLTQNQRYKRRIRNLKMIAEHGEICDSCPLLPRGGSKRRKEGTDQWNIVILVSNSRDSIDFHTNPTPKDRLNSCTCRANSGKELSIDPIEPVKLSNVFQVA